MRRHDESFACMGTTCRVLIEDPVRDPSAAGAWARRYLEHAAAGLTRFDDTSELSRLNADARETVEISPLLHAAIGAALWAAAATNGLVDPTLHDAIRRAGYADSIEPASGPPPTPRADSSAARPDPGERWRTVRLGARTVTRPPGLRLDTGGTTKGLLSDSVAHGLDGFAAFVVDCGGDMRVGGTRTVNVANPLEPGHHAASVDITNGAVATTGIARRHWKGPDGRVAHHLLDPSTGEPAWTGLVSATALAPTALEAEARAKAAFLTGPARAPDHLHPNGGVLVHESGRIEHMTPIQERIAA